MTLITTILTFGATAVQCPAPSPSPMAHIVLLEPLRTNTHVCYVGGPNVTNDGSGTGVIRELAAPGAISVPLDQFSFQPSTSGNPVDPTIFYAHGFLGEKAKLTYVQI